MVAIHSMKAFKLFFLLLIVLSISLPIVFSVRVELLESSEQCISCYSIYKIINDKSITPLSIDESTLWFEFRKPNTELSHAREIDTLRNWNVEIQDERLKEWTEQILTDENCTTKDVVYPNGTAKETTCNPKYTTITHQTPELYWKPFENKALDNSKELIIKVSGNIKVNSAIDNVLVLKDETNTFTKYTQWVWWNNSYDMRMPINCSLTTTGGVPILVNGSGGFYISGEKQLVWTHCRNASSGVLYENLSVYYMSAGGSSNWTIATDHGVEGWYEVELGNRTSFGTTSSVWQNYSQAWTFKETTGTNVYQSNGGTNNGTATANMPVYSSGKIGWGRDASGTTSYTDVGTLGDINDYSVSTWVNLDNNNYPASGEADLFGTQKATNDKIFKFGFHTSYKNKVYYGIQTSASDYKWGYTNTCTLSAGTWYNVVATRTGTTIAVYVNGANCPLTGTSAAGTPSGAIQSGVSSRIGTIGGVTTDNVDGKFDYTIIATRVMTNLEINDSYFNIVSTAGYGTLGAVESSTPAETISYTTNYTSPVYELSNQSFWVNLSWTGNITGVVATNLEYNNTNYSLALLDNGSDWKRYNTSIIIPLTEGTSLADENRSFKFFYNYTNTTGTYSTNTSTSLQRVMEAYFINSLNFDATNVPELSNTTATVNISKSANANYSVVNWSVLIEFNGANHTVTTSTINNETFNYTEFIGIVTTNNTQINHSAYINLEWNGINASRSGFTPHQHLLTNYYPVATSNGNVTEGNTSIVTVTITNVSGPFNAPTGIFNVEVSWNGTNYQATQINSTTWQYSHVVPAVTNNTIIAQIGILNLSYAGTNTSRTSPSINQTIIDAYNLLINLYKENDESFFNVSWATSVKARIFCNSTTVEKTLTSNSTSITDADCDWISIGIFVTYTNQTYYRTYTPPRTAPLTTLNAFLIDLTNDTAIQKIFYLNDLVGTYRTGTLKIEKIINANQRTIHQDYWDIENKVIAYFILYNSYIISLIDNTGNTRVLGNFLADTQTTHTITVPNIPFSPDQEVDDFQWNYEFLKANTTSDGWLFFQYNITAGTASNINFVLRNMSNLSQIFLNQTFTGITGSVNYTAIKYGTVYQSLLDYTHSSYSTHVDTRLWQDIANLIDDSFNGFSDPAGFKKWLAFIIIVVFTLIFSGLSISAGAITTAVMTAFFYWINWLPISPSLVVIIGVITLIMVLTTEGIR